MQSVFCSINYILQVIIPLSNFLWEFPTNFEWYRRIPALGNIPLSVLLLLGSGIYFSFRLRFIQVTHFKAGIKSLTEKHSATTGISPLASFFLSSAMRVGSGNIIGVTGAIATGGPGALFWMWVSAFFGMAAAYIEAVLSQIFKEKRGDEFVGGLPFYGRKLLGNKAWIGIFLSFLYLLYALCCLPAQGFNVISSVNRMTEIVTGSVITTDSVFSYVIGIIIVFLTAAIVFGGVRGVARWTDRLVPVMALLYIAVVLILILLNASQIPFFFASVLRGAFRPEACFGGAFGTVLAQGVKRGLMSNEAGQGTITMAAAAANAKHPCEQGIIAAIGVFLDTIVICTLTGFVVITARCWQGAGAKTWAALDRLPKFITSIEKLIPGNSLSLILSFLITLCFALFSFTTLLGLISFSEIAASRVCKSAVWVNTVIGIALFVITFGVLCSLAGLDLGNLWAFSDLGNILIVFFNIPLLHKGAGYVYLATKHYRQNNKPPFSSAVIGWKGDTFWDSHIR